jgi:hypothetical protein
VASATAGDAGRDLLPELSAILARLEQASVARLVDEAKAMLPSLAAELGKPAPAVLVQHAEAQLVSDWTRLVKDVLVQSFRNSLYHGIETSEAREVAGKPKQGSVHVRTRITPAGLELQIFDDGRGLALAKLREQEGNRALSDEALAELIFDSGVSTAESVGRVAGRGVGMDIVRAGLRARGGDALLRFTGEERGGYRPFMVVVLIPKSALVPRSGERRSAPPPPRPSTAPAGA